MPGWPAGKPAPEKALPEIVGWWAVIHIPEQGSGLALTRSLTQITVDCLQKSFLPQRLAVIAKARVEADRQDRQSSKAKR